MSLAPTGALAAGGNAARPNPVLAWWLALRPWSFTISLAPGVPGPSLAMLDGHPASLALFAAALVACVFIHAGTNLQNDVGDFRRGAALSLRIGPPLATTACWFFERQGSG